MAYIYDDATGRVAAIILQGSPTLPSGFTSSADAIGNTDVLKKKRDIGSGALINRDALVVSGVASVRSGTVGQVAVRKIDGTTLEDKADAGDNDPIVYRVEHPQAFENKSDSVLVNGADAVKIGAPAADEDARFLVFSPELQLLDTKVSFD